MSGLQWIDGRVFLGTVWDDDDGPGEGRVIGLDAWIDECLAKMAEGTGGRKGE